jgi:hypothetical protein
MSSFIFYPNRCTLPKALDFYSLDNNAKITLSPKNQNICFDTVTVSGGNLTISGSFSTEKFQLNPNYFLKFSTETMSNDYGLFMNLISDKTG